METLDTVNREGRERLYPALTNPSWLVLRRRREIFRKWLARVDGRDLDVLDVGGRIQPYRPLLEGRTRRYVAVDLRQTPLVSVVGRGEQIPFAEAQFDLVICTQVLEYIPEPAAVVAEIYRVLKPGGLSAIECARGFSARFRPRSLAFPAGESEVLAAFVLRCGGCGGRVKRCRIFSHRQCLSGHVRQACSRPHVAAIHPDPLVEHHGCLVRIACWQFE